MRNRPKPKGKLQRSDGGKMIISPFDILTRFFLLVQASVTQEKKGLNPKKIGST
jgi:hypothetical protein